MATYRFEAKIISRASGRSSVHAASHNTGKSAMRAVAYRMRESLLDETTGITHDYSRKFGGNGSDLYLPDGAPSWMRDRQKLWNAVEKAEPYRNSQLARDFVITLPYTLTYEQHRAVIKDFVSTHFLCKGKAADVGYHAYGEPIEAKSPILPEKLEKWRKEGVVFYERGKVPEDFNTRHVVILRHRDGSPKEYVRYQPHVHVMVPLRTIDATRETGFARLKDRPPDGTNPMKFWKQDLDGLRRGWASTLNRHLEAAGLDERVDHRKLVDRGIDRKPEPKKGPVAAKMERDGLGDKAHAVVAFHAARADNKTIREIDAEIFDLDQERRKRMTPEEQTTFDQREAIDQRVKDQLGLVDQLRQNRRDGDQIIDAFKRDQDEAERLDREKLNRRTQGSDITDATTRWLEAVADSPRQQEVEKSMASAVAIEGARAKKEHDELTRDAAEKKNLDKKRDILMRRDIQFADYMAITEERQAGISRVVTGFTQRRDLNGPDIFDQPEITRPWQQHTEEARKWREQSDEWRTERKEHRVQAEMREIDRHIEVARRWNERNAKPQTDFTVSPEGVAIPERPRSTADEIRVSQTQKEAAKEERDSRREIGDEGREVKDDTAMRHAALRDRLNAANERAHDTGRSRSSGNSR